MNNFSILKLKIHSVCVYRLVQISFFSFFLLFIQIYYENALKITLEKRGENWLRVWDYKYGVEKWRLNAKLEFMQIKISEVYHIYFVLAAAFIWKKNYHSFFKLFPCFDSTFLFCSSAKCSFVYNVNKVFIKAIIRISDIIFFVCFFCKSS